jgi:hypothetical protein
MQLALLENVKTANALLPSVQKGLKGAALAINIVGVFLSPKKFCVEGPTVVELKDRVHDACDAYKKESSSYLLQRLRLRSKERTGSLVQATDTELSVKIIDEAAALYKIDEWLTPAEKAEAVCHRHQEESLGNLSKMVAKMSPAERAELEKTISQDLAKLSHEHREAIQRDMKLSTLSGESLTMALLATGGPLAGMAALSAAGFGAYLALTTIIHAVATTALGITLPFAFYTSATSALSMFTGPPGWALAGLAMMVTWHFSERKLSRTLFAGLIASASEYLPTPSTFVPPSSPLDPTASNRAAKSADDLERSANEAEQASTASRQQLLLESGKLKDVQAARGKALRSAGEIRQKISSSVALRSYELIGLETRAANAETLALTEMMKAKGYQAEIVRLTAQLARNEARAEAERQRQNTFEDGESKRQLQLWAIHFPKMTFARQPARWIAHKNHQDRLSLEKKLMELHNSDDPVALSRGKMRATGEHHLMFRLGQVECRLFFRMKGKNMEITELGTNQQTH